MTAEQKLNLGVEPKNEGKAQRSELRLGSCYRRAAEQRASVESRGVRGLDAQGVMGGSGWSLLLQNSIDSKKKKIFSTLKGECIL